MTGLENLTDSELKTKITSHDSVYNDNKTHINHIYRTFQLFINRMQIGDIVIIPQPSKNDNDGTNLHVVKVLSDIKYNSEFNGIGCSYYRDAEWSPNVIKWRTSPYDSTIKKDISLNLMRHMWKPEILRKTLTGAHQEFISEFIELYGKCNQKLKIEFNYNL